MCKHYLKLLQGNCLVEKPFLWLFLCCCFCHNHKLLAVDDGFSLFGKRTSKNKWQSISRAAPAAKYTPDAERGRAREFSTAQRALFEHFPCIDKCVMCAINCAINIVRCHYVVVHSYPARLCPVMSYESFNKYFESAEWYRYR